MIPEGVSSAQRSVKRKYVLSKVKAGDYLLPSNDASTIWRIATYVDGPSNGLDIPADREFWGIWRWTEPLTRTVDPYNWDLWAMVDSGYDTRADAIREALRLA